MNFDLTTFLIYYVALIVSLVIHEAAHAWVAMLGGDRTAYEGGQVTLNPIPHMRREPFGTIYLPVLTYAFGMPFPLGFAHAPYNPYWADAHPRRAAIMSAAGPISNILLAIVAFTVLKVGLDADWFERQMRERMDIFDFVAARDQVQEGALWATARITSVFLGLNIVLAVFNIIPVPPLDGAGVAEGLLPGKAGQFFRTMRGNPTVAILGLIVVIFVAQRLWIPVFLWAYELLGVR